MKEHNGDIWLLIETNFIVIPTNIGWRRDGTNVMGAGLAKQAANYFPTMPFRYGEFCKNNGEKTPVKKTKEGLILFPVKVLNVQYPHLSWKNDANLELIERSTIELDFLMQKLWKKGSTKGCALPLVGCGNGKLKEREVLPILKKYLKDERYLLVRYDESFSDG